MQKAALLFFALCVALVAAVDLSGKTREWSDLTATFQLKNVIIPPAYSIAVSTNSNACRPDRCTTAVQTIYAIAYAGQGTSYACLCNNPVMNISYVADNIGRVPYNVRQSVIGYTVSTVGVGGGADTTGGRVAFYDQNENTEVFIHESSHAFDNSQLSFTTAYYNAETADTCIPDAYAGTNDHENFAQLVVTFTYMVLTGTAYPSCMTNQLNYINSVLPSTSVVGTTTTVHSSTITAGYFNSCNNIGFNAATTTITATCYKLDGTTAAASININNCITNQNGVLSQQCNGNFAGSCSSIQVSGTNGFVGTSAGANAGEELRASCGTVSSTQDSDELNLSFIGNNNGVLSCGC